MGYDDVAGYLPGGMVAWHMSGRPSQRIETLTVQELCTRIDAKEGTWILDVRGKNEIAQNGAIPGAHNIHLTQLPDNMKDVPKDRDVFIFCGSGLRSMIAASLLKKNGWDNTKVVLGGLAGWSSSTCPINEET
jgi:hydroxyacylglutathione hydrolase